MIAHSAQLRWLPGTLRPHPPVLTALINAARLALAAPLALVAAVLLLVGLALALVTIALHPYLGRRLWGSLEEAGPAGARTVKTSAKVAVSFGRHGGVRAHPSYPARWSATATAATMTSVSMTRPIVRRAI